MMPTAHEGSRDTALVTGAAGGIGAAVVRHLASLGTRVVGIDRDEEGLARLASGCDPARVSVATVDITSPDAVEHLVTTVESTVGPLTQLVNGAGVLRSSRIVDQPLRDVTEIMAVNVLGTMIVSRCVVGRMVDRGAGAVVTVTSNAARVPRAGLAAYSASKAAAEMFTRCLALETAGSGVRCNVVAPGSTDTAMLRALWDEGGSAESTVVGDLAAFRTGIPLQRVASPEDVSRAVAFLLSDDARHITMHSLVVDGGASLGV